MSCLGIYHVPSSLACYVYSMLCSIFFLFYVFVFHLSFIFSFILHHSCITFYPFLYLLFFPSFLLLHLFICDKKGEEYTGVFCHFYITHVHILRERNSISCTFIGEKTIREMHISRGRTHLFEKTLFCLVLPYACFLVAL